MGRACVFIDGGYFQKILEKDFQKPRIDFDRIGPLLSKQYDEFLRTYYYNCPPYQSASPSPAERRLISNADRFYYSLKNLNSFEVRLGRLAFRGIDRDTGEPIFQQKRVDVQLAVDLVTLAFSKQIRHCLKTRLQRTGRCQTAFVSRPARAVGPAASGRTVLFRQSLVRQAL